MFKPRPRHLDLSKIRLFRCHSIMNCGDVCPKGLNPTRAMGKIKELLEQPDDNLLDFVMGRVEPVDARCRSVLELMRSG